MAELSATTYPSNSFGPWRRASLGRVAFALLALASIGIWLLPEEVAVGLWATLAVALLLAIPLFWKDGHTWLVLWLAPLAAFEPFPTGALRAVKYVLLAAAIMVALAKRNLTWERDTDFNGKALWPSVALLLWLWITALWGNQPLAGALEAGRLTLVAALIYLWLTEPVNQGGRRRYFVLWMIMATFEAIVCTVETSDFGAMRSYGTFPNANAMGAYFFLAGALCFATALSAQKRLHKVGLWALLLGLIFGLYLTGSRAAWLAFLVTLLVMAIAVRHWRTLLAGSLVLATAGVVYMTQPLFQLATNAALRFQTGLTHRPLLWEAADRARDKSPLFGYGLGAAGEAMSREALYPSDIHRSILTPMMNSGNPHNYYRELELEAGVVGVILLALAILAIVRGAWRGLHSQDRWRKNFALTALGITAGLLVHAYFERSLFLGSMSSAIFYWFVIVQALRSDEPAWGSGTRLKLIST